MMLALLIFILLCLLTLISFVQLLYLESLRLRTRETEAMKYFKDVLADSLGYETEDGALAFSLIKHTLLVVAGAACVVASAWPEPGWSNTLEGFAFAWVTMIGASYLLSHLLYRRSHAHWVTPLAPLLRFLVALFRPLRLTLGFLESLQELSEPEQPGEEKPAPGEEIEALITAGEEGGIIEKEDSRLIQSVVAFGDKRVREVMTPRPSIVAIEVSKNLEELRTLARNEQYSRIPVYEGTIDRMAGFIHVRDLFEMEESARAGKSVRDLMRPILRVPETKPASELLREMQANGSHIVYVVDEYGNVAGLATMEDLVEEIFGEIRDEHEPGHDIQRSEDGAVTVSGSFDVDHLRELFDFRPEEEIESTTVGGLVTEWLGAVPKAGASIERDGIRLEVVAADDLRVERVRISRLREEDTEAETE
jgi:putative hemolysin